MFKKLKDVVRSPFARMGAGKPSRDQHQNDLLDEGLMETFPASDPVSVVRIQ